MIIGIAWELLLKMLCIMELACCGSCVIVCPEKGALSVVVPAVELSAIPMTILSSLALSTPLAAVLRLAVPFKKQFPVEDPVAKYETPWQTASVKLASAMEHALAHCPKLL